ncbi:hypothetical protein [Geoalkalibacter halelectricus]|uniref:hypothetical protein n=1 Tax=Geoalkalibacter halelectricus TaxID=2847045 RepID=UPI00266EE674|nr:hypothetical protein [Geoalkalibacter halelectricus]
MEKGKHFRKQGQLRPLGRGLVKQRRDNGQVGFDPIPGTKLQAGDAHEGSPNGMFIRTGWGRNRPYTRLRGQKKATRHGPLRRFHPLNKQAVPGLFPVKKFFNF